MRSWRFIPLLLLLVLLPFACSQNDSPTNPGGESGVLRGRVVDSSRDGALGGVVVRIEGTDQTAVTSADGSFEFTGLPGGTFTVVVEPPDGAPYQSNRIEVSVQPGAAVTVDCTVLPDSVAPGPIAIYPPSARVGVLESVQFYIGGAGGWIGTDGSGPERIGYRPTWSIRSEHAIGVVSREGIFIGTAVGRGQVVASLSASVNAVADIEVVADGAVARIIVHPPYMAEMLAGESRYLAAHAVNGAGDVASGVPFSWSVVPATLGTIEPVTGLSPEERAAIIAQIWYGMDGGWGGPMGPRPAGLHRGGDDSTTTVPPDSTGPQPPGPLPPGIDPSDISLVRFTANLGVQGEARGQIRVGAQGASWTEAVEVYVQVRGTLTTVNLFPEEVGLAPGTEAFFFALGVNEWSRPIGGLAYAWSVEPASLGTIERTEAPWVGPTDPADPNGGGVDPGVPWPPMPPVPPGGPLPDRAGSALFRAVQEGEGLVRCVVTDSLTGLSIEKTATVRVAPAPALDRVEVRPNPIEATVGDSLLVEAVAFNTFHNVDQSAKISWSFEGNAGRFVPIDGRGADGDSTGTPGGPAEPPVGGDPTDPPIPGGSYGVAYGYFYASNPGGSGTLTATATGESGVTVTIDVPVRVPAR
jgi:hypothetical protein